jgi:hypothetical protein
MQGFCLVSILFPFYDVWNQEIHMNPLASLFLGLILSSAAFAARPAPEACTDFHVRHGAFHFQRLSSSDGSCFLTADPFDVGDFFYRSYLLSNDGLFMVFNSYGQGENSTSSGARVYYFFPRKSLPELMETDGKSFLQFATPGIEMILSQSETKILGFYGAEFKEDPKVNSDNKGGLEITKAKTLYMDAGFALGHDVTTERNSKSTFHDTRGESCEVLNKEVFSYTADGDTNFKFTDSELKEFLKTRCPRLKPNF